MTSDFLEGTFFGESDADQRIKIALNVSNINPGRLDDDEVQLDALQYQEALKLHVSDPYHIAIRRYMIESVMKVPIEIRQGSKIANMTEFIKNKWLIEQVPQIMEEVWTLGLATIELQKDPESELPIPFVYNRGLGMQYKLTVRSRRHRSGWQYRVYNIDQRPHMHGQLKRNNKAQVYDIFGTNPLTDTGRLTSISASLLPSHLTYQENYRIARVALMNMARPMLLCETQSGSQGIAGQFANRPAPLYGGQDYLREDEHRERVSMAAVDLDVITRHQDAFWKAYYDRIEEQAANGSKSVHQAHHNIIPLPPGHKSASFQRASSRDDWMELTEIHEDEISSAYGLQRSHLQSSKAKFQISESLANATLVRTINRWRDDLSKVFTDLLQKAFGEDSGEIVFPKEVNDTPEGLYTKWEQGLLSWEGYLVLMHEKTGIDLKFMKKKEPPRPSSDQTASTGSKKNDPKSKKTRDTVNNNVDKLKAVPANNETTSDTTNEVRKRKRSTKKE